MAGHGCGSLQVPVAHNECISHRCYCCGLEDMLAALKKVNVEMVGS